MTLSDGAQYESAGGWMGANVFEAFYQAKARGVQIDIVIMNPSTEPLNDTLQLAHDGIAEVRLINWTDFYTGGIMHTKLFIVDGQSGYVGSANADWRSLAQVKELGIMFQNCPAVGKDAAKVFEEYWLAAEGTTIPKWPSWLDTKYNMEYPLEVELSGETVPLYFAASPDGFDPPGRTSDLDALVTAINNAQKSVCVEVMDYSPSSLYEDPNYYWPVIDQALRAAAFRGCQVRLMFGLWPYTLNSTIPDIMSLSVLANVSARWFVVPYPTPPNPYIPYTRVNHAKYCVTEDHAYIGTSNWSADYYVDTAGMSFNSPAPDLVANLQARFDRDWDSAYTIPVTCTDPPRPPMPPPSSTLF